MSKEKGRCGINGDLFSQPGRREWISGYDGLIAKFSQNEDLKSALNGTGESLLAECAVKDKIWGIGLSMDDPDRFDPSKWKGQNLPGYALMMVRDKFLDGKCWSAYNFQRKQGKQFPCFLCVPSVFIVCMFSIWYNFSISDIG